MAVLKRFKGLSKGKKALVVVGVLLAIGLIMPTDSSSVEDTKDITQNESVVETITKEEVSVDKENTQVQEEIVEKEETLSLSQKNAIKQAENYLKFSAFSRQGLISQLEFEGYSNEDSVFAVDNIEVDWNEQCAKKAEDYLEYSAFSRDGLYGQLEFEGFTPEQIEYGLASVGY